MRTLILATWVFINVVFFGMCIYMYLLWSQYWMGDEKDTQSTTLNYDQEIYYYNHGYPPSYFNDSKQGNLTEKKNRIKHAIKENSSVIILRNSRPRFPSLQANLQMDTLKYICLAADNASICLEKTLLFKKALLKELNRVVLDESNVLKEKIKNPYNVTFTGARHNYVEQTPQDILKAFLGLKIKTIRKADFENFINSNLKSYLPRKGLFENRYFKSCAVVASSGALKHSNLGKIIDSHNVVLRFNDAPTRGFESDVGQKTTMRVVNSQVISQDSFLNSKLFTNVTLVAWDPSNYTSSLEEWYEHPEHPFFLNYKKYKEKYPKSRFFIVNPSSLWDLWTFLQSLMPYGLRKNPPSSGFLGIAILLPHCDYVDVFEYVPSVRVSKRCHYYDKEDNPACTLGVWHPLAAEKLLAHYLNTANDSTVFQKGYIRIPGYQVP